MDKVYHNFLNQLVDAGHPWPDSAVKRALFAKTKTGAGLTKIPLEYISEDYTSKSQAQQQFDDIDDDLAIEALYLTQKDTENTRLHGFERAVEMIHDVKSEDIRMIDLPIERTPEIPLALTGGSDVGSEFRGVMREVTRAFSGDISRGYDHADSDRKRIKSRIKKLIEQVS